MTGRRALPLLFLFVFSVSAAHTQQHPLPPIAPVSPPAAPNSTIEMNTVVLDADGNPVSGLLQRDFTVRIDKLPQPIAQFAGPAQPTEALILVDAVNTGFSTLSYARNEIDRFFRANEGKLPLPVSVAVLTDKGVSVLNSPSRDGNALAAVLDNKQTGLRVIRRSAGFYGATERLDTSLHGLASIAAYENSRPVRKLVVWISPGWAYLSGPRVYLGDADLKSLFNTVVGLSTALRQARITLYDIDPLGTADAASIRTTYYQTFLKPVRQSSQVLPGNLSLQALAANSGGRVLYGSNSISGEIAQCLKEADGLYTLAVAPAPAEAAPEFHTVKVEAAKPGLTVRTPAGYYALLPKTR